MKLFCTLTSPFARKVRVVVIEKGLTDKIEIIVALPRENPPELHAVNPLGKIPALVMENGKTLYDSPVICEYLDSLSDKNPLYPKDFMARMEVRKMEALADGMMDAYASRFFELARPENERSALWTERWENAIKRSLDLLETGKEKFPAGLDIGSIALAAAMFSIRKRYLTELDTLYPKCGAWLAAFEKRKSMQETLPPQ